MKMSLKNQAGFSIVSAIFLITVMAIIGAYMIRISATQHTVTALSVEGIRAHFAARSAMEWALAVATRNQADHDALCSTASPVTNITFSTGTLNGFQANVICNDSLNPAPPCTNPGTKYGGFQDGPGCYEVDQIDVLASRGAGADYISRSLRTTISAGETLP